MKKLLSSGDKILIAASFLGDLAYDLVKNSSKSRNLRRPAFILGSSDDEALTRSTYRLLRSKSLEKIIKGDRPYLRITSFGRDSFYRDFPLFEFQDKPWSGYWCVVNYDIPEKLKLSRNALREKLISLGFGAWKKSCYISPHDFGADVREWIQEKDLDSFVSVSEARELAEDEKKLSREVFDLPALVENYEELLAKLEAGDVSTDKIQQEFFKLLLVDPLLPRELLPVGWPGFKIKKLIFSGKRR